jgi:hypothetical protein
MSQRRLRSNSTSESENITSFNPEENNFNNANNGGNLNTENSAISETPTAVQQTNENELSLLKGLIANMANQFALFGSQINNLTEKLSEEQAQKSLMQEQLKALQQKIDANPSNNLLSTHVQAAQPENAMTSSKNVDQNIALPAASALVTTSSMENTLNIALPPATVDNAPIDINKNTNETGNTGLPSLESAHRRKDRIFRESLEKQKAEIDKLLLSLDSSSNTAPRRVSIESPTRKVSLESATSNVPSISNESRTVELQSIPSRKVTMESTTSRTPSEDFFERDSADEIEKLKFKPEDYILIYLPNDLRKIYQKTYKSTCPVVPTPRSHNNLLLDATSDTYKSMSKLWIGSAKNKAEQFRYPTTKEFAEFIQLYFQYYNQIFYTTLTTEMQEHVMNLIAHPVLMMTANLYKTLMKSAFSKFHLIVPDDVQLQHAPVQILLDFLWENYSVRQQTMTEEGIQKEIQQIPLVLSQDSFEGNITYYEIAIIDTLKRLKVEHVYLTKNKTNKEQRKTLIKWIHAQVPKVIAERLHSRIYSLHMDPDYVTSDEARWDLSLYLTYLIRETKLHFTINFKQNVIGEFIDNKSEKKGNKDTKANNKDNKDSNKKPESNKKNGSKSTFTDLPTKVLPMMDMDDYNKLSDSEKLVIKNLRIEIKNQRKLEFDAIKENDTPPVCPVKATWESIEEPLRSKLRNLSSKASNENSSNGKNNKKSKKNDGVINFVLNDSTSKFVHPKKDAEEDYEILIDNEVVPAMLDTGCKPYDVITTAFLQKYLPDTEKILLDEPLHLLQVSGQTLITNKFVKLEITLQVLTGEKTTLSITPLLIDSKHEMLLIGSCTLKTHGLIDFPQTIKKLHELARMNKVYAVQSTTILNTETAIMDLKENIKTAYTKLKPELKDAPVEILLDLVDRYRKCFRYGLDDSPLADFPPLKLELIDANTQPFYSKPRKMPKEKAEYLEEQTKLLLKNNLCYVDTQASWISPAFAVAKGDWYRMVLDYVRINKCLKLYAWPMPSIENIGYRLAGSRIFGTLDLDNCYYQFPLEEKSQKFLSFQTTTKVFTPRVVPMGVHNAVPYVQSCITNMISDLPDNYINWVDDLLSHGKTFKHYVQVLEKLFKKLLEKRLKLNPLKCSLLNTEVTWLGRTLSEKGMSFPEKDLLPFKNMKNPTNAAELQAFLCGLQWFRNSLPHFASLIKELQELLLFCTRTKNTCKKSLLQSFLLKPYWKEKHEIAMGKIKEALNYILTISFLLPGGKLCVFTDASENAWGILITQVMEWIKNKDIHCQDHRILGVASGIFTEKELIPAINEKEAFVVNESIERFSYLLKRPEGFTLFTDHFNLKTLLDISNDKSSVNKNTKQRMGRYAANICQFAHEICQIFGKDNIWADWISRLTPEQLELYREFLKNPEKFKGEEAKRLLAETENLRTQINFIREEAMTLSNEKRVPEISRVEEIFSDDETIKIEKRDLVAQVYSISNYLVENTPKYKEFHNLNKFEPLVQMKWPRLEYIFQVQKSLISDDDEKKFKLTLNKTKNIYENDSKIWIPSTALKLIKMLCVLAHSYGQPHLPYEEAVKNLKNKFIWESLNKDLKQFCKECLQCQMFNNGKIIKRSYGEQINATPENRILQFDYLYIRPQEYILVLMDRLTSFSWFFFTTEADGDTTVQAFRDYDKILGLPKIWLSDQGSHFKNELMKQAAKVLQVNHNFTTVYCPWANGSVERLNRSILELLRKLLSENQITWEQWNCLLPTVNKLLNERPLTRKPFVSPRELMIGQKPISNLDILYANDTITLPKYPIDLENLLTDLRQKMDELHSLLEAPNTKNKNFKGVKYNFNIGDYVLVATHIEHLPSKLKARWTGPFLIIASINSHVFQLKDLLISNRIITSHVSRMKLFNGQVLPEDADFIKQSSYDRDHFTYEKFIDLIINEGRLKLIVKWLGYENEENTIETIESCIDHNPDLVKTFLLNLPDDHKLKDRALKTPGLRK